DRGPDRRGDGGTDRGVGGCPGADRHGQGHRPGGRDQRRQGRGEDRRQERTLAPAMTEAKVLIKALAISVSNRASAGLYADRSGPELVQLLRNAGCLVDGPQVIPDGDPVEAALRDAVQAGYDVVVTSGGTGLTPMDRTPEMTRKVIDREITGIAEAI